jgi:heptosyltransferase-3
LSLQKKRNGPAQVYAKKIKALKDHCVNMGLPVYKDGKLSEIKKILVYRIGSLGDNLVAIPAIRAAKKYFPSASFTLLSNQQVGTNHIPGGEIYNGSGLFDAFLTYPVELTGKGKLLLAFRLFKLILTLRRGRFDALIYLPPTSRVRHAKRDRFFFRLAGIRRIFGSARLEPFPPKVPGQFLPPISHEADALLEGLRVTGIPVPPEGQGDMDLGLGEAEEKGLAAALGPLAGDGGRAWVGVGPGSKQPAKVWPEERFRQVVERLIREHDIWPIVLSGNEDQELGDRLVKAWGRGYNLAGKLSVRASALALKRCALYLGNDTGTMPAWLSFAPTPIQANGIPMGRVIRFSGPPSTAKDASWWFAWKEKWNVSSPSAWMKWRKPAARR